MATRWIRVTHHAQMYTPGAFLRWKGKKSHAWSHGITAKGSGMGELMLKNTIDGPVVRRMIYLAWPIWEVLEAEQGAPNA